MAFQVGDKVIHASHGVGEIVRIEDKTLQGHSVYYYVVRTPALTVWVPVEEGSQHTLRAPASQSEFESYFAILSGPQVSLPGDRLERKKYLLDLLKDGQLSSLCRVVRDLSVFVSKNKFSDEDKGILERAKKLLLDEWVLTLSVSPAQARQKIGELLDG